MNKLEKLFSLLPVSITRLLASALILAGAAGFMFEGSFAGFFPSSGFLGCGIGIWLLSLLSDSAQPAQGLRDLPRRLAAIVAFYLILSSLLVALGLIPIELASDAFAFSGSITNSLKLAIGLIGVSLLLFASGSKRGPVFGQLPLLPVFWIGYVSLVSGVYRVRNQTPLFEQLLLPWPAATLLILAVVGILSLRPQAGLIGVILSPAMGGVVARLLLPIIVVLPFTLGWSRLQALRSGAYPVEAGFAAFTSSNVTVFVLFLIFTAFILNRLDERRRQAYDSLQHANLELQAVNLALSAKIEEQVQTEAKRKQTELQLFQSQKMEAMGTLASGIAHDFNNILTVIQLNVEDALEVAQKAAPDATGLHKGLQEIRKSGVRAADVVRQIMTFGRKTPGEKKPVQPGIIVREALEMLKHSLPDTVEVCFDIGADHTLNPTQILADPTQVQQVLINLGTNAAHAMADSGGRLDIKLEIIERPHDKAALTEFGIDGSLPDGRYVRISFADTGHGIADTIQKRIFDPFFTTKPPGKGTGLGLSVAHGIMVLHGGSITVESRLGHGSLFRLYFPALPA